MTYSVDNQPPAVALNKAELLEAVAQWAARKLEFSDEVRSFDLLAAGEHEQPKGTAYIEWAVDAAGEQGAIVRFVFESDAQQSQP